MPQRWTSTVSWTEWPQDGWLPVKPGCCVSSPAALPVPCLLAGKAGLGPGSHVLLGSGGSGFLPGPGGNSVSLVPSGAQGEGEHTDVLSHFPWTVLAAV